MENNRKLVAQWNSGNQHNYGYVEVHCENDYTCEEDAKRVNICLLSCEHISTERLEAAGKGKLKTSLDSLHSALELAVDQRDTLLEFVEEVRRSGDTRLASMAIAVLNKVKEIVNE